MTKNIVCYLYITMVTDNVESNTIKNVSYPFFKEPVCTIEMCTEYGCIAYSPRQRKRLSWWFVP